MGAREHSVAFMPYGLRWRTHRRLFHDFINPSTVQKYDANQIEAVSNLLVNLHREPETFREHIELCALHPFAILTRSIYHCVLGYIQAHRLVGTLDCVWDPGRYSGQRPLSFV